MKKKELLKRIETLEFKVNGLTYRLEQTTKKQYMYMGVPVKND